jgi:hypothetical protein
MPDAKVVFFLIGMLLGFIAKANTPTDPFPDLSKLIVGEWQAEVWDGLMIETWSKIDAAVFEGKVVYLEGRDTVYSSTSRIEKVGGEWMLFNVIQNSSPMIFQATSYAASHLLFENAAYGNTRQIRFDFEEGFRFKRTVIGEIDGKPGNSIFNFEQVPQIAEPLADRTPELRTAFSPLVGKTWRAAGKWWSGVEFRQEVRFDWNLEKQIVVAAGKGFIEPPTQAWGQRNFGTRYWNKEENTFQFSNHELSGGKTEGTITLKDGDIYYHYDYNGIQMTDLWEKVDEKTYNFKVGLFEDGKWTKEFLNTQFTDINTTEAAMMKTNLALPYRQIPDAPEEYDATTVAARMIDGLGFRYYWATEGLRQQDLDYRTTPDARSSAETLDHIYGLARMVRNAIMETPNGSDGPAEELTFAEQRTRTLQLLAEASGHLKESKVKDLKRFNIVFQRGENQSIFPFWNVLNGPLADATWHVGQIVASRRSSGNPFNSKVSVLTGKVRE